MGYAETIRQTAVFERLRLSAEDRERGRYYSEQRQRLELRESVTSLEDFYRSLQQVVEIAPAATGTIGRISQLTQKTNQFNLTTPRYSVQQIQDLAAQPGCHVFSIRASDRFGDNGLVGVLIAQAIGPRWEIDTFLLSCRVIGRTVETALLSFLVHHAQSRGGQQLEGWFKPTQKNAPARDFYPSHGFGLVREEELGSLWRLELAQASIRCPEWVELRAPTGEVT
jgi:FkbH-like protein